MTIAEEISDDTRYVRCLDHGFCGLIDHMGCDDAVAEAARTSYAKGTKSVRNDRGLIRYLLRHRHSSPFEMCVAKFHIRLPIFVARQFVRHRTASINEVSGRYSILETEFYIPQPDQISGQSRSNNQGRELQPFGSDAAVSVQDYIAANSASCAAIYEHLLEQNEDRAGLARELARMVLPLNLYTEWYWTANLHNIMHFLKLRLDSHAQYEIRVYAEAIYEQLYRLFPECLTAFDDYVGSAVTFSRMEMTLLRRLIGDKLESSIAALEKDAGGATSLCDQLGLSSREYREFSEKIAP